MQRLALAFLLAASFTPVLRAQSTNASLMGRIADPAKARIVDARVAAVRAGTNVRYETTTNASGEYYLSNLPPGDYRLEIEKQGFKKIIKPSVTLHVQDALELDFEMTLVSCLSVRSSRRASSEYRVVDGQYVIDRTFSRISSHGRSFQTLIRLRPGVS